MPEPALALDAVGLRFPDGTAALDDVTLHVAPGELVAVVGPSGCGKSTLLRLASGLATPTRGTVRRSASEVGYVFQDATLLPWRTVQRNAELVGEMRGLSRAERRHRASEALDRVGLADFARHRPGALSGGMRMRASLARSLVMRPDLFLFDEPFGALDEITRGHLLDSLGRLFTAERFAGVFVTHSVREAALLASRVVVLTDRPGRVVADVPVPFAYPREPELAYDPAMVALTADVSASLRGAVRDDLAEARR